MKRSLILVPLVLGILGGCTPADQDKITADSEQAFKSAKSGLGTAWNSVSAEASKVSLRSSKEALDAARSKTVDLQKQLAGMKMDPAVQAKLDALKLQVQRLDAALLVQDLRKQSDDAVKKAMDTKQVAEKNVDEARRKLKEMDDTYRDLDARLKSAERTYNEANSMWSSAMQKLKTLTSATP